MKKTIFLFILIFLTASNIFSQDRSGTIFYSSVERTEELYNIIIDIYEIHGTKYIEVELFDANEIKLASNIATLIHKDNKYYLKYNEEEKQVVVQDINLALKNPDNNIEYPMVKVKLLDQNYQVVDFSQKVFY
ncbi:hypothetical protein [Tenacibaculum sp. IB213877]|uniref:hypothetical protein n=1 Tax=Tenacibaculum sp. IB213877 TaxID=3097351 RepID=UPI002A5A1C10|nr:hypothetical protein [Tenacibaculum sp. IB213877]MDY0780143.1 hypothetical protein [Tenacibaculum sp. IB213877]